MNSEKLATSSFESFLLPTWTYAYKYLLFLLYISVWPPLPSLFKCISGSQTFLSGMRLKILKKIKTQYITWAIKTMHVLDQVDVKHWKPCYLLFCVWIFFVWWVFCCYLKGEKYVEESSLIPDMTFLLFCWDYLSFWWCTQNHWKRNPDK